MAELKIGDKAPAFKLEGHDGNTYDNNSFIDQWVVLYFYPRDDTPGCTVEAKEFSELMPHFKKLGCNVVGVSPDTTEKHCKFTDKHGLKIILLADPDKKAIQAFGAWVEKSMYGRKYMGVQRSTFLIGPSGKITHIWPKVKAKGHARQVLDKLAELEV